jgi:hypothetical protein
VPIFIDRGIPPQPGARKSAIARDEETLRCFFDRGADLGIAQSAPDSPTWPIGALDR